MADKCSIYICPVGDVRTDQKNQILLNILNFKSFGKAGICVCLLLHTFYKYLFRRFKYFFHITSPLSVFITHFQSCIINLYFQSYMLNHIFYTTPLFSSIFRYQVKFRGFHNSLRIENVGIGPFIASGQEIIRAVGNGFSRQLMKGTKSISPGQIQLNLL